MHRVKLHVCCGPVYITHPWAEFFSMLDYAHRLEAECQAQKRVPVPPRELSGNVTFGVMQNSLVVDDVFCPHVCGVTAVVL